MRKVVIGLLAFTGILFGIVWWFDVESTGGNFSDFFSDPVGGTQSLVSRFSLWIGGVYEMASGAIGGSEDPKAIASALIAGFESFSSKAYPDPAGQTKTYSIGYGHQIVNGDGYSIDSVISESDALAQLQSDLDVFADCVDNAVTVDLSAEQRAALYSLCYNIGCSAFRNSTLVGDLNIGDYSQAQAQFSVWNKAGGNVLSALTDRRAKEAAIFGSSGPQVDASDTEDSEDA